MTEDEIVKIKQIYREERNDPVKIEEKIDEYRYNRSVFQTAWILKKAAELKKSGDEKWERYLKMAEEKSSSNN